MGDGLARGASISLAVIAIGCFGACGGDSAGVCNRDGGAACFQVPTEAMSTYQPGGNSPPLQIGCGEPIAMTAPATVTLGGHVTDYDSNQPVVGASVEVFHQGDSGGTAIATATTDATGAYSMDLPSGTPDLLTAAVSGGGATPELLDQLRPDLGGATASLELTTITPASLDQVDHDQGGVDRDDRLGQVWVRVLDCDRFAIVHAVVALSTTAGARDFLGGVPVFYGSSGVAMPLPDPGITETGDDGTAVALNVPLEGNVYVQAWGFSDAAAAARGDEADLVLVAEKPVLRLAGAATRLDLYANQ